MSTTGQIIWTREQREIIEAHVDARLIVEAGPGTGKTAVACARVVNLIAKENVTPSSILMVSFTRTAVAEMKNRIRLLADRVRAGAVNISTLDQTAFSFGVGCGQAFEKLMNSFDGNIDNAIEKLRSGNELLRQYLFGLQHVIFDEAQDLTGQRSELAILLIASLAKSTGVTIFADHAQAIYGFTTDVDGNRIADANFLKCFDSSKHAFKCVKLEKIHRTNNARIITLFHDSRKSLTTSKAGSDRVQNVIDVAENAVECLGDNVQKLPLENGDLLLYRKRASALMHAVFCPKLFRLRLPNHPPALFPWLGLLFSSWIEPLISRREFAETWATKVPPLLADGFILETAWEVLYRFCGKRDDVDVSRLRTLLCQPRPNVEFCYLDYGGVGPVFSTIHASKGREADRVFLMLPRNLDYMERGENFDPAEESRVYYVGSTRARKEFLRGLAHTMKGSRRLENRSDRVIHFLAEDKLKFQVGLTRDFDDVAPISRSPFYCASHVDSSQHQQNLIASWTKSLKAGLPTEVTAAVKATSEEKFWPYQVIDSDGRIFAWSADSLTTDLWKMTHQVEEKFGGVRRPPPKLHRLKMIGLRTCVVAPDDATTGRMHEPFASSGFWLAPMIIGFPSVMFFKQNGTSNRILRR